MSKIISALQAQAELAQLLDQLEKGTSHFIIERNNQPSAVLLNIEKFQEIMQMLDMLNALEFIGQTEPEAEIETGDLPPTDKPVRPEDGPPLTSLPGKQGKERASKPARTGSIEEIAAKLGIRLIK